MKDLTAEQRELFKRVYDRHMSTMGTEERRKYVVDEIKEIKWDGKENCLKVYFKNGDWWHYGKDETWW